MDRIRQVCAVAVLALTLAACGGQQSTATFSQATGAQQPSQDAGAGYGTTAQPQAQVAQADTQGAPAGGAATVSVANSAEYGQYLTDGAGRALYLFTQDTEGENTCTGECAANWPVLATQGDPQAAGGFDAGQLSTVNAPDGSTQVRCGNWPLYYYAGDNGQAAVTNGQGVGEVWYLVNTACQAIRTTASGASAGTYDAAPAPASGTEVAVATCGEFGECLVDGQGRALYRFTEEGRGEIACTGDCEANWPPYTLEGSPTAGNGADAALLGTISRGGKLNQATCDDWPLYYYAGDNNQPNTFNGQGVGGNWFLVAADCSTITG